MLQRRQPRLWVCSGNPSWLGGWEGLFLAMSSIATTEVNVALRL